MAGGPKGTEWCRLTRRYLAGLLVTVIPLMMLLVPACINQSVSGPPLIVLSSVPCDGGGLADGDSLTVTFNLPVDANSLHQSLKVSPPCALEVAVVGPAVRIRLVSPQVGAVYTLRIEAGVRGLNGEGLRQAYRVSLSILPEGSESTGKTPGDDPGGKIGYPSGAILAFEGAVVGGCDVPGAYRVPRFDLIRMHFPAPIADLLPPGSSPALLAEERDGSLRLLTATVTSGRDWFELALQEELRPGQAYECVLWTGSGAPDETILHLWQLTVRGPAWHNVWSLDLETGRASPVGRLDLGYEIDAMISCGPGVIAVGSPGGGAWQGLQIAQYLTTRLEPVGEAAAVLRDANHLPGQVSPDLGMLVAVGPAGVPPLVGAPTWSGYSPALEADDGIPPGAAVIAFGGGEAFTLLGIYDLDSSFASGPSLRADGGAVSYVASHYGGAITLRLLRCELAADWLTEPRDTPAVDWVPVEMARSLHEIEYVGQFSYPGGAMWDQDDGVWWSVNLPDGTSQLWRVEGRGGSRELIGNGLVAAQMSPDGTLILARTANGGAIYRAAGAQAGALVRTFTARFTGATWLPDSSGLLLASDEGITHVPLGGSLRRLTNFPARTGFFVKGSGSLEYWFISDRRV